MSHIPCLMSHISRLTCRISHLTSPISHLVSLISLISHFSFLIPHMSHVSYLVFHFSSDISIPSPSRGSRSSAPTQAGTRFRAFSDCFRSTSPQSARGRPCGHAADATLSLACAALYLWLSCWCVPFCPRSLQTATPTGSNTRTHQWSLSEERGGLRESVGVAVCCSVLQHTVS